MFTFLLIVHAIIAAALVAVILMQRSEGGGLGVGGSPSGLMSARGAADFLTRATTILASLFVLMSIGLAALATVERAPREIDTSLARQPTAPAPEPVVPMAGDPLAAAAGAAGGNAAVAPVAPPAAPAAKPSPPAQKAQPSKADRQPTVNIPAPAQSPTLVVPPRPTRPEAPANDTAVPLAQ
jgi:preprotein translocase subunit SecG